MFKKPIKTDSEGNITELNITNKMKKQLREAHKGEFKPYSTSVKKICDEGGHPEYFIQIRNRFLREVEQNMDLGEFVAFDLEDLQDIRLTTDGVFIFFEILTSYFEENDVRELLTLMLHLNESARAEYNLNHSISSMTTQELKSLAKCLAFHRSFGFTQYYWECGCSRVGASVLTILGTSPGSVSLRDNEMRRRSVATRQPSTSADLPHTKKCAENVIECYTLF